MATILDIFVVAIILFSIIKGYRDGLIKMVVRTIANLAAFLLAFTIAKYFSNMIYTNFIRDIMITKASEFNFSSQEIDTLKNTINQLPEFIHSALNSLGLDINSVIDTLEQGIDNVGLFVVDNLIQPVAVLLMSNILVVFIYMFLSPIIKLILGKLHIINRIPFLGNTNRYVGGVGGILIGVIDWIVVSYIVNIFIIATADSNEYLNSSIVASSNIFKIIYGIGLF